MASLKGLQKRYDTSLRNDDYYGAEQAVRMMHHRLTQGKNATSEDISRALEILLSGACTLLEKGQPQAGTALGLLAVKHCNEHKVPVTETNVSSLISVSSTFDKNPDQNLTTEGIRERLRFLKAAQAWSTASQRQGNPKLNTLLAHAAAAAQDFTLAQRVFVHSDDPSGYADVLFNYATEHTLQGEIGLVLTRAILRYLLSQNVADAIKCRERFAQLAGWRDVPEDGAWMDDGKTPPLAHFCQILVKIVRLDATAAPLFKRICDAYRSQLSRDESFSGQLTRVGQMYFNIQPPQPSGLAGMMGTMLRGMMSSSNQ